MTLTNPLGAAADPIRSALAENRKLFGAALGFSAAMSVLALTTSFYMLEVYDRVLNSRSLDTLLLLSLIATGGVCVFSALDSLRLRLLVRIGMRFGDALSPRVLRAMVAASSQTGGMAARQGLRDVDTIRNFISSPGFAALMDAPFLLVFLVVLFLLHWAYFVIVLIGGGILIAVAFADQIMTAKTLTQSIGVSIRAHEFAEDGLRNADVLEGMGMSSRFVSRWRARWVESLRLSLQSTDKDTFLNGISRAVRQLIYVALLGTGALLVIGFQASGGVMIAASILGARALAPIEACVATWKSIVAVRLASGRLTQLLNNAPKRDEGMALPAPIGKVSVEQASYYVPNTRKPILSNITFALEAGESVGVIGPSASGKSTLMRLVVGAWPCTGGTVRLDGANIFAWPRDELGKYIGYLPQDIELFSGTVAENIARLADVDSAAVVKAAELANAHEMILSLPKGYDTEIGERGHQLSGGQRQRVGLARALYGEPKLVVLDEPNSNLDGAGEEALSATLVELKRRRVTVAMVAHRPSALATLDKILVLRDGVIVEFGPTAQIMQKFAARQAPPPPPRPAEANVVALSSVMHPSNDHADKG
jgi:PrtD family type I secretion system ABC transporter